MVSKALTTTSPMTGPLLRTESIRGRLIEREKALIAKTEDILKAARQQGAWETYGYRNAIALARQRLDALRSGLLPIRIGGNFFHLRDLINTGQYIPPEIAAKAAETSERFPKAAQHVYGLEANVSTEIRRRRDPILTLHTGDAEFFLGFWLEVAVPDETTPEFFGMIAPLLPRMGRGRPRKIR